MISYAQNFEDVVLMRAFRDVANGDGFYIDVGASDPDFHSVTKAFYERGWRGINVEPLPGDYEKFCAARPRDINIRAVIAVENDRHGALLKDDDAGCRTLADVCEEHAPCDIHFLRIDVDGAEREVIAGADFDNYRPLVILVQVRRQASQEPNFAHWEPLLTSTRYRHVYSDGLNRFYLAEEADESLADALNKPPNVFDDFVTIREDRLRAENAELLAARAAAEEAMSRAQPAIVARDRLESSRRFKLARALGLVPTLPAHPEQKPARPKQKQKSGRSVKKLLWPIVKPVASKARDYLMAPLTNDLKVLHKLVARDQRELGQLVDAVERALLTMTIELRRSRERNDSGDEPRA